MQPQSKLIKLFLGFQVVVDSLFCFKTDNFNEYLKVVVLLNKWW
jgi:hypothetical protein